MDHANLKGFSENPFIKKRTATKDTNVQAFLNLGIPANYVGYFRTIVYRYARKYVETEPMIYDIIGNGVLARLASLVKRYDPDKSPFDFYIKRMIVFSTQDELKAYVKEKGLEHNSEDFSRCTAPADSGEYDSLEFLRAVCAAASLTEMETKILFLSHIENRTQKEIKELLEFNSISTVSWALGQAVGKLVSVYGDDLRNILKGKIDA